jgi:RNA polymerase sigma-70 factor, ECF subfamily
MSDIVEALYRQESRRVFSTLVRLLGSFDLAEDALHDAFVAASEQWPRQGLPHFGAYALQAAIAAVHAEAPTAAPTDWPQIVGLYDALMRVEPSPVIALNRAVAVGMRDGPEAGLALIEPLLSLPALADYHAGPAAAADMCRRAGRRQEAATHYRAAAVLARQEPERRFLLQRLAEMGG